MTDFLSHLAARAFETGERILPRPVSMFEPSTVAPEAGFIAEVRSGPAPRQQDPEHQRVTLPHPVTTIVTEVRNRETVSQRDTQTSNVEPAPEWARRTGRSFDPAHSSPPPKPIETPELRAAGQPVTTRLVTIHERVDVPANQPPERTRETHPLSPAKPAARPLTAPPLPVRLMAPPPRPEAPVIIEVTIGRVEVRAIEPSAPKPKAGQSRSGPALSLDAYLKQRNRGK